MVTFIVFYVASTSLALEADDLALVVNRNVPAGRMLAEFYARQRHVPEGRIIELSLPAPNPGAPPEEISPEIYGAQVVRVVREFLTRNHLERQVKCLVTFWGVPLRVTQRSITDAEKAEHVSLEKQVNEEVRPKIEHDVAELETFAHDLDATFHAGAGDGIAQLTARAGNAMNAAFRRIANTADATARSRNFDRLMSISGKLLSRDALTLRLAQPEIGRLAAKPPTAQETLAARDRLLAAQKQIASLQAGPQNADARTKTRDLIRDELGLLALGEIVQFQAAVLDATQSEAAFDSELALLWWPQYPKAKWQLNPLYWRYGGHAWSAGPVLMVTRLDGPSQPIVHEMIATSIKVEQEGLKGQAVLDGRGKTGNDPYASYDSTIRHLAQLLREHSKMQVTFDDKEPVFTAHSLKDIALYCGWYSLRNYVAPGQFNPGAVGFHVASFELVSLRNPGEKGWVRGLLNDGVAATVGPVAEPYLQSFPPADEFFPLLLTGKLTLAEVYWRTSPWASWMQTCIGDPLYRPYLHNPQLTEADLPEPLRRVLSAPTTRPTVEPRTSATR